ncbi:MAG: hypothetical protein KDC03_08580, partial [Flavobacteriales bacterium]|nr:hypothetical protein [Flavobacteriales bacterium]
MIRVIDGAKLGDATRVQRSFPTTWINNSTNRRRGPMEGRQRTMTTRSDCTKFPCDPDRIRT